jgi:glucosamine 6-phosphate synthetase-like amidotransferase/phosphosugar isomerase protein
MNVQARHGSPIVVGIGKDRTFVASEVSAFSRHTKQYISLKDGEVAVVKRDGVSLDMSRIEKAPDEKIESRSELKANILDVDVASLVFLVVDLVSLAFLFKH